MRYTAHQIRHWDTERMHAGNKLWVPARPLNYGGLRKKLNQIKIAWGVLTGKYDALDWEDQS